MDQVPGSDGYPHQGDIKVTCQMHSTKGMEQSAKQALPPTLCTMPCHVRARIELGYSNWHRRKWWTWQSLDSQNTV